MTEIPYCYESKTEDFKIFKPGSSEPQVKENKMFKKALHRVVVIWCLYGLAKVCIFVNPLLFKVWAMISPIGYPPILGDGADTFGVWAISILAVTVLVIVYCGVHRFSNWFFNTGKK